MRYDIPLTHPLRKLFRWATRQALSQLKDLSEPLVQTYISDEVLAELLHTDRIYRLRTLEGRRLQELASMAGECKGVHQSGLEREMEVNQHIGDFALFMAGMFPENLNRRPAPSTPLLATVGGVVVPCSRQLDYYLAEGAQGYRRASELWGKLSSERAGIFTRLSERFEGYVGAMGLVRYYLRSNPDFTRYSGLIA